MTDVAGDAAGEAGAPGPWNVVVNEGTGEAYRLGQLLIDIDDRDRLVDALPDGITIATKTVEGDEGPEEVENIDEIDYAALGAALEVEAPPNTLVVRLAGDPAVVDEFLRAAVAGEIEDDAGVIRVEHNTVFMADAQASPVWASPVWASGRTTNIALPADRAVTPQPSVGDGDSPSVVIILDSGLADLDDPMNAPLLQGGNVQTPDPPEDPDENGDLVLDPVAGHGTFIAGLVELATPGVPMFVRDVMEFRGDTDVGTFMHAAVEQLIGLVGPEVGETRERFERTVIGMSFSGPMSADEKRFTYEGLRFFGELGIVVVAAAGNDSTCDRMYPAAFGDPSRPSGLENVVSVGALGRCGPAAFTNHGPWVRACAEGEMLTSSFFSYDEPHGGFRQFNGWAQWSGTSFSVGVVMGAFVREMWATGETAVEVVRRLVDQPGLPSVHNLGTIVS